MEILSKKNVSLRIFLTVRITTLRITLIRLKSGKFHTSEWARSLKVVPLVEYVKTECLFVRCAV